MPHPEMPGRNTEAVVRSLRIAILLPGYAPNPIGGYKIAFDYATGLAKKGYHVEILQSGEYGTVRTKRRGLDRLRPLRHLLAVITNRRPAWARLPEDVALTNRLKTSPDQLPLADVYIATAAGTAHAAVAGAARAGGVGLYLIQHYEDWAVDTDFLDETWRLPLHRLVIAPWLQAKGRELGVESVLLPNWIDPQAFAPGPEIAHRPLQVAVMLSPMAFKRADLLCLALEELHALVPEAHAVGFGVAARPQALPNFVEYIQRPTPDRLREIYATSRVYVCASDSEGWHLPPAEAMACGCTVVSTDIGGVRSYADGIALFTTVGNAGELAEGAASLLRDPERCDRMSRQGIQRIANFTFSRSMQILESEIERIRPGGGQQAF